MFQVLKYKMLKILNIFASGSKGQKPINILSLLLFHEMILVEKSSNFPSHCTKRNIKTHHVKY